MKMKFLLCVAICSAAAVGAYLYLDRKKNQKENVTNSDNKVDKTSTTTENVVTDSFADVSDATIRLKEDKTAVVEDIKMRHEAAATEMREALNNIVSEPSDIKTENTDTLNDMLSDLDKLME